MRLLSKTIYYLAVCIKKIFSFKSRRLINDNLAKIEYCETVNFGKHFKSLSYQNKIVLDIGSGFGGSLVKYYEDGAQLCCGIDIDKNRTSIANKHIKEINAGVNACAVVVADARCLPIRKNCVDILLSKATFEHIMNLDILLDEAYRVLKPGGEVYACWSPAWYTYNGGHLWNYLPIPWLHILMPTNVIISALKQYYGSDDINFPRERINNIIGIFQSLTRLSCRSFRKYVCQSGFKKYRIWQFSKSKLKKILTCMPIFDEVFAGSIYCALTK